jgi:hypothetical protein
MMWVSFVDKPMLVNGGASTARLHQGNTRSILKPDSPGVIGQMDYYYSTNGPWFWTGNMASFFAPTAAPTMNCEQLATGDRESDIMTVWPAAS